MMQKLKLDHGGRTIMAEYIEREALLAAYDRAHEGPPGGARKLIAEAPAADAAPVRRGKWKYYHKQNRAVCTECSFERNLDHDFGKAVTCPNCGARMDLGGVDNG